MMDESIEASFPLTLVEIQAALPPGTTGPASVSMETLTALTANQYDLTTFDSTIGLYDVYGIRTSWTQDTMKLAVPIGAGPSTTNGVGARVAVLGGAYGYKIVDWIVIRKKFPPALPAVEESQYCQLLTSQVGALNDCLEPDDVTTVYSRQGQYVYVLTKPVQPGVDTMETPSVTPVFQNPSYDIESGDFKTGMAPVDPQDE